MNDKGEAGWASPDRVGEARVSVRVLDTNDNAPVFLRNIPLVVKVSESAAVGTVVAQIPASDLDAVSSRL